MRKLTIAISYICTKIKSTRNVHFQPASRELLSCSRLLLNILSSASTFSRYFRSELSTRILIIFALTEKQARRETYIFDEASRKQFSRLRLFASVFLLSARIRSGSNPNTEAWSLFVFLSSLCLYVQTLVHTYAI